jgi:hypothetical protein
LKKELLFVNFSKPNGKLGRGDVCCGFFIEKISEKKGPRTLAINFQLPSTDLAEPADNKEVISV